MGVPFFDIRYNLGPGEREALLRRWAAILDHGRFINGPEVAELEDHLCRFLGVEHALACSNGSDALVLALKAVGVEAGDEVIVPSFTFFATAGAVARLGAVPVFADIDPVSYCLDPESAAAKAGRRTKAVIPVHLYGQPAEVGAIRRAVEQAAGHEVVIVEDAAQAVGAVSPEGPCGGLGAVAGFSCFPTKNLGACGDAGFVTTRDPALAERMRRLREHGGGTQYHHDEVGFNFRQDSLQAAALLERLDHLLEYNAARREAAEHYGRLLSDHGLDDRVTAPTVTPGHVFHQYVLRVPRREELRAALQEAGIGSAIYYPVPLHRQPCFAALGYAEGDLAESERAAREVLALPIHPGVDAEMRVAVVGAMASFYSPSRPSCLR
ncbi:MAG: DegT/DnrJ/EryC1/StrS family aminotransferase [Planctomycetes bacterium]|nr:DegT/DnrJ/EryC1/StrS family aminotransferase [Planctomycetota bacterium]